MRYVLWHISTDNQSDITQFIEDNTESGWVCWGGSEPHGSVWGLPVSPEAFGSPQEPSWAVGGWAASRLEPEATDINFVFSNSSSYSARNRHFLGLPKQIRRTNDNVES